MKKVVLLVSILAFGVVSCSKKADPALTASAQKQSQEQTKQVADTAKKRGINITLDTTMKDTTIILQ